MTTSLKFKEKATDLDTRNYKCLLLALVKLIHADPKLLLHVSLRSRLIQTILFSIKAQVFIRYRFISLCELMSIGVFFFYCLESSQTGSRDAKQHSRAHHWPGAASASNQHHPTLTRSHGGQTPQPTHTTVVSFFVCLFAYLEPVIKLIVSAMVHQTSSLSLTFDLWSAFLGSVGSSPARDHRAVEP